MQQQRARIAAALCVVLSIASCALGLASCSNNPYPAELVASNTLIYTFDERSPRYLDPVASYSNPESAYTYQIYESPYGYHYLKRPYVLEARAAAEVVQPAYFDKNGQRLPGDAPAERIAESVYDIPIRKGILYQPHPALAKDAQGRYRYHTDHALTRTELGNKRSPWDFEHQGTRELVAEDFVYNLKRHATTRIEAPIFAVFAEYVVGLKDYAELIKREDAKLLQGLPSDLQDKPFLDFRRWPLAGVTAPDRYTLRIRLIGKYPQWRYWMAMPFTAPLPWEADAFYAQPGMAEAGLSLNQWPLGTGPFMMRSFERDRLHVLERNPNYRGGTYPCEGEPGDKEQGLLDDCGKRTPFVDRLYVTIEKERTPRKEKFRQGFIDVPEIERPEWGVSFTADADDSDEMRKLFAERKFKFPLRPDITNWYLGFNMLDPVVGNTGSPEQRERKRKLRQAISIAIDWEEGYARIFRYKGGDAAHSPLPPGPFGAREQTPGFYNPVTHRLLNGKVERRPLDDAKKLLAEAGYPEGRDAQTGRPLVLNYDFQRAITPEFKAENDWMARQFAKIGIQLEIRATDFNQFQDKAQKGRHQIFWAGWLADYPDAENFLFLLYGPNAKSKNNGENIGNYENARFDALFREMQTLDDTPRKQQVIDEMVAIVQHDAPWSWGYISWSGLAFQQWVYNGKPSILIRDMAQYYRVDPALRVRMQAQWNRPIAWPLLVPALGVLLLIVLAWRGWRAREQATARRAAPVAT